MNYYDGIFMYIVRILQGDIFIYFINHTFTQLLLRNYKIRKQKFLYLPTYVYDALGAFGVCNFPSA